MKPVQTRVLLGWAALLGFSAVAAGAFGAHGVSDPRVRGWLQTGGEYGMIHALATIAAVLLARAGGKGAGAAGWAFVIGGTIFSGSLYAMALTGLLWLGAVTPIGGLSLLFGWGLLSWAGLRFSAADASA